jgi:hypothetical protein
VGAGPRATRDGAGAESPSRVRTRPPRASKLVLNDGRTATPVRRRIVVAGTHGGGENGWPEIVRAQLGSGEFLMEQRARSAGPPPPPPPPPASNVPALGVPSEPLGVHPGRGGRGPGAEVQWSAVTPEGGYRDERTDIAGRVKAEAPSRRAPRLQKLARPRRRTSSGRFRGRSRLVGVCPWVGGKSLTVVLRRGVVLTLLLVRLAGMVIVTGAARVARGGSG